MLEQILNYIHNFFEKDIVEGKFEISDGSIHLDFLQENQYFRVCGSVFNDGVHKYPADDLVDEEFYGSIWALAIPPAVLSIANDIEAWVGEYGTIMDSPYQSESFGGYSYTKGNSSGSGTGSGISGADWRSVFGSRLNQWRKIA